jgi:hypothetical protein
VLKVIRHVIVAVPDLSKSNDVHNLRVLFVVH